MRGSVEHHFNPILHMPVDRRKRPDIHVEPARNRRSN
jgi:hypothetical protein